MRGLIETQAVFWRRLLFFGAASAVLVGLACSPPESGSSDNGVQKPGQQERGRSGGQVDKVDVDATGQWLYKVHYSDIVLAPNGHTLLVNVPLPGPSKVVLTPTLQLVAYDLDTAQQTTVDAADVVRIQFSVDGKLAWLLADGGTVLKRLDLATGQVQSVATLAGTFTTLDRSPDGKFLVVANLPRSDWEEALFQSAVCTVTVKLAERQAAVNRCRVQVVPIDQPATAQVWQTPRPVRDLDFSPFRGEILLTWSEFVGNAPQATLAFYQPGLPEAITQATAANCGDELVLAPQAGRAFLAPSSCQKDPISVFNLDQRTFEKNLPGFGPVAIVGQTAIGFVRHQDLLSWGSALTTPFGLIAVDVNTLAWQVHPWGSQAPTFSATPDGQHLLLWQEAWQDGGLDVYAAPARLTRIRVADWQVTPMANPSVRPRAFVWRADGDTLLALSAGELFALRISDASVQHLALAVSPELLQQRPSGQLLLGESDQPRFYRYDVVSGLTQPFDLTLGATVQASVSVNVDPVTTYQRLEVSQVTGQPTCSQSPRLDAVTVERFDGTDWHTLAFNPYVMAQDCTEQSAWLGGVGDGASLAIGTGITVYLPNVHSGDRIAVTPTGPSGALQARLVSVVVQVEPVADPVSQPFSTTVTWTVP